MAQIGKIASWGDNEILESTADPNVSVSVVEEELPALTVATIVGVTIVMLIAIIVVFLFGVLIDWRQQRVLASKMGEARRSKNQRRVITRPEDDDSSIVHNMEDVGISEPPAAALRNIP